MRRALPTGPFALLLAPYGTILIAVLLVPLCMLAAISAMTYSPTRLWDPVLTLGNYANLAQPLYAATLLRTLWVAAAATAVTAILAYPTAYFVARSRPGIATVATFLLVAPLMVSTVIRSFGWILVLSRRGLLATALGIFGLDPGGGFLDTQFAVVVGLVQILLPLMVLPLVSAIEGISPRIEEAAASLGCGPFGVFRHAVLPLSRPGLLSGVLLCFTVAASAVITPALLGGRRVRMAGNLVYEQVVTAFNWPAAASIANVLALLSFMAIAAVLFQRRSLRGGTGA